MKPIITREYAVYHLKDASGAVMPIRSQDIIAGDNENLDALFASGEQPDTFLITPYYNKDHKSSRDDKKKPKIDDPNAMLAASLKELANTYSQPVLVDDMLFRDREIAFNYGKLKKMLADDRVSAAYNSKAQALLERIQVDAKNEIKEWRTAKDAINELFVEAYDDALGKISADDKAIGIFHQAQKSGWADESVGYMQAVWEAYIKQYPYLKTQILHAWEQGHIIVEDSNHDRFWGIGKNPTKDDCKIQSTEVMVRLICKWKGQPFPQTWWDNFVKDFNSKLKLTGHQKDHYIQTVCQQAGPLVLVPYDNLPLEHDFKFVLVRKDNLETIPGLDEVRNRLVPLIHDYCFAADLDIHYYQGASRGNFKFCFESPTQAAAFRQRFMNRFGILPKHMNLEGASYYSPSKPFAVTLKASYAEQLGNLLRMKQTNPVLFPHFGQAYLDLLTDIKSQKPGQAKIHIDFAKELTKAKSHQAILDVIKKYKSIAPKSMLAAAKAPFAGMIAVGFDDKEAAAVADILYQYDRPSVKDTRRPGDLEKQLRQGMISHLCDTKSVQCQHEKLDVGNGKQSRTVPHFTATAVPADYQQYFTWDVVDYASNTRRPLITQEMVAEDQQTVQVVTWNADQQAAKLAHAHFTALDNNKPQDLLDNQKAAQCLIASQVHHLADLEAGVYAAPLTKKHQYVVVGENCRSAECGLLVPVKKSIFHNISTGISEDRLYDNSKARYQVIIEQAIANKDTRLSIPIESTGYYAGDHKQAVCRIKAQALIEVLAETRGIDTVIIPAAVINGDTTLRDALEKTLASANYRSAVDNGAPKVVVADLHPRAGANIHLRFAALNTDGNPGMVGEVIPGDQLPLPGYNFQLDGGNTIDQSSVADSTRLLAQHATVNPRLADEGTYLRRPGPGHNQQSPSPHQNQSKV